ncbi:hypothetical protein B9Z55_021526 [Caenorhabditis nigoni]|uniref:BTB domain-containing protein n=2 Tax=Caenorhabditis nigoni TaxID=1611254 RepID=A0A2G5TSX8_9PELO|nr:hypothetical protein B9Z55_021526 [Caenorhabditis nigoni]
MGDMDKNCMYMKWFMGLERIPDTEGDRIRAYIRSEFRNENARISFFVLFKFSKLGRRCASRGKHKKGTNGTVYSGHRLEISEILNRPNEWLTNGALEIDYGIHLEAFHSDDGIWNFNFRDELFNVRKDLTLKVLTQSETYNRELYCHKAQLQFHSQFLTSKFSIDDPVFSNRVLPLNDDFRPDLTEIALQIAHGVRPPLSIFGSCEVVKIAEKLKLRNVSRYCERQMIQCMDEWDYTYFFNEWDDDSFLKTAIKYDLNHLLAHMMTKNYSIEKICDRDIQQMSRNTMMLIISQFMETYL